jgi:hypothetical protein
MYVWGSRHLDSSIFLLACTRDESRTTHRLGCAPMSSASLPHCRWSPIHMHAYIHTNMSMFISLFNTIYMHTYMSTFIISLFHSTHTYIHTYVHTHTYVQTLKATPNLPWSFLLSTKLMKIIPTKIIYNNMHVCMYVNKLMSEPDLRRPYYRCKYPILRKYVSLRDHWKFFYPNRL